MSKKKSDKPAHPLAPLLIECLALANAFEALAADARKDAQEAQAEMERLAATVGFLRYIDENNSHTQRNKQRYRLAEAQSLIEKCESLVCILRRHPMEVRDNIDTLMRANEIAASPRRRSRKARK